MSSSRKDIDQYHLLMRQKREFYRACASPDEPWRQLIDKCKTLQINAL
jgi:hypothetical protein